MRVYIEDITEEYKDLGVDIFSMVYGMDFYYATASGAGVEIFDGVGFDTNRPMRKDDPMYETLKKAIYEYIIGEMENEN